MGKIKWVKQLTRENTLLDRGLRCLAYKDSVKEIGRAAIKSPIIGFGRITSLYYDPEDYKRNQDIIVVEFAAPQTDKMGQAIIQFMEAGYAWAQTQAKQSYPRKDLADYLRVFNRHHAHARGAITYSYWGEPAITARLRTNLSKLVDAKNLDQTISTLSTPRETDGLLTELHHSPGPLLQKKAELLKSLNLKPEEQQLVEILSWFTLLYELGERVSSYLFTQLITKIKQVVDEDTFAELEWYDPESLLAFFASGERLAADELSRRQLCYVVEIVDDQLHITSGEAAQKKYQREFEEQVDIGEVKEIKGTTASPGKVTGKVRLVITQAQQANMLAGEILVSTMTTPQLMGAMRQAAAIVTDEGGMTAHAAIVARELGIPCIVGTKIATKVLKDGDLVEVDAEQGLVRKI